MTNRRLPATAYGGGELVAARQAVVDSGAILAAGRRHDLSGYDAAYLVLAERLAAPLATVDIKLAAACRAAGLPLLANG